MQQLAGEPGKEPRTRSSPTRTPTVQLDDDCSSASSRHRAQDAVILECERLRQAVDRCGQLEGVQRATGGEGGCGLGDAIDECSEAARLAA